MSWLRDRLIDGLLLALPLIAVVYLLAHLWSALRRLLEPLAVLAPQGRWLGIAAIDIIAIAALLVVLAALGVFARSGAGRALAESLERLVLRKIPGFLLFKSIAAGFTGEERETGFAPALVAFDDNTVLGFVVEQAVGEDTMTVFVPSAPTPAAGSVVLVPRSRVTLLDASTGTAIQIVTRLGIGLQRVSHLHRAPVKVDATQRQ